MQKTIICPPHIVYRDESEAISWLCLQLYVEISGRLKICASCIRTCYEQGNNNVVAHSLYPVPLTMKINGKYASLSRYNIHLSDASMRNKLSRSKTILNIASEFGPIVVVVAAVLYVPY